MSRIEEFEELRPLLFSIAHRIVGSDSAAEDALHETWLRYEAAPAVPVTAREYLSALVTRVSADVLRSARLGREPYRRRGGEPLLTDTRQDLRGLRDPGRPAPPGESPSAAAVLLLERLSPADRTVFVLWEVFGCSPAEIASALGCSEAAACGRLAAVVAGTRENGETMPWPAVLVGADHVARALAAIGPALGGVGITMESRQVRSRPGAVFRDRAGRALGALTLDFLDGRVQAVRWVGAAESGADGTTPDVTP